jgi:hypothetical protein
VSELPAPLQALAPTAREEVVKQKLEERQKLQKKIAELSIERDAYVAKENERRATSGKDDGFDAKVREAVKNQAAVAGITY